MPREFTPKEKEILEHSPADSPVIIHDDADHGGDAKPAGEVEEDETLPGSQWREPAEGGRREAGG